MGAVRVEAGLRPRSRLSRRSLIEEAERARDASGLSFALPDMTLRHPIAGVTLSSPSQGRMSKSELRRRLHLCLKM